MEQQINPAAKLPACCRNTGSSSVAPLYTQEHRKRARQMVAAQRQHQHNHSREYDNNDGDCTYRITGESTP